MTDYICLGISTLDLIWSVPTIPQAGNKVLAQDFAIEGGGMAATAAVTIARLGGQVEFWGRAGEDNNGQMMRDMLESEGVGTSEFRMFEQASSPVASVIVDCNGERQISTFRGNGIPDDTAWLPLDRIAHARAVLADMRWEKGAHVLFTAARHNGIPTVLDADIAEPCEYESILKLTDYALFSESGLAAYCPGAEIKDALASIFNLGCKVVGVTQGAKGLCWWDINGFHYLPAFTIDVVDTTGAGDVFHGAFTLSIGQQSECSDAMRFASAAAALKCGVLGGRKGIPSNSELTRFLQQAK